jgi:hypothetical protein
LLGLLASDQHCPVAKEAIQQPHIGKIIAAIRSRFKVRDEWEEGSHRVWWT